MAQNIRPPTCKLVLVAIATYANSQGNTTVTQDTLSLAVGIGDRALRFHIAALKRDRFISVSERHVRYRRIADEITVNFIPAASGTTVPRRMRKYTEDCATGSQLPHAYNTLTKNVPSYTNVLRIIPRRKKLGGF